MEFKPYESRQFTRMAFQITLNHVIIRPKSTTGHDYTIGYIDWDGKLTKPIKFNTYEEPKVGDWIVRLTDTDTYHCTDAVFRARNIVPK